MTQKPPNMNTRIFIALSVLISGFLSAPSAWSQGTVFLYNYAPSAGLDAPVFDVDGTTRLSGYQFDARLLGGPSADQLKPLDGIAYGFLDGYISNPRVESVPGVEPGQTAYLQLEVWSTVTGSSYDQVLTAGGKHGASDIFSVLTGGDTLGDTQPPTVPAFLTGLESFNLLGTDPAIVPEPSTLVLVGLGLGAGLWTKLKRRA